ncbi:FtsH protease activity modulator HflK [Lysobacter sp. GX 14042]|uniref:FtsH protease activity modulator HflK n=1 Tax=Lysobacter sp. GX 14042 TaxID=2907155 RepID=UPI001F31A064|nr:FtsH protease activity modulator HflK [Lysobacter sp. GX 14042]MCE7032567.1 FtsH protease activity modulator HflK [Lysobacter sp. GX 14042]
MAWNSPGSNDPGGKGPRRGNGGLEQILDPLRNLFGGGGGIGRWVLLVLALWLAANCFVLIAEQQRGVVLRFGEYARLLQPGPHFKLPWPLERVVKVNATSIKNFGTTVPVLTADENIVQVEINVQYRVSDPRLYLFGTRDGDAMLTQAALSTVREQVGRSPLDTVLGARNALAVSARDQLQASLDAYRTGLVVTELNLPNARPPEEVKPAFDDVNSAQQDQDRLISEAEAYAAQVVPEARGTAARVRATAQGYREASIARAQGDADRFSLLVDEYQHAPGVTRKRLWLETVQGVLADNRKVVGGDSRQLIYVPMDGAGGGRADGGQSRQPPLVTPELLMPEQGQGADTGAARSPRPTGREEVSR